MASMIYEMGVKSLTDINVDKPFYTALFIVGGLATAGVIAYSVIKGQLAKRYYNRNIKDKLIQNEDVFKTDALRPL